MDGRAAFEVATMRAADLAQVIGWAADEGWNPGESDGPCFLAADPDGFLIGRLAGRDVASISAVRYPGGFGFIGLYIVVPEFRGLGLGYRLWTAAIDRLAGEVVGLDGVVAQQENYARSGFVLAHRNTRFAGTMPGRLHADIVTLNAADLTDVAVLDEPCFGAPRPAFLQAWLDQPGARGVGVRTGGRLAGYGVIRPSRVGFKIGPLFADDVETAEVVLDALAAHAGARAQIHLDVPVPNAAGMALAHARGMVPVFETARMYRGGDPGLPLRRIFGITSFELG